MVPEVSLRGRVKASRYVAFVATAALLFAACTSSNQGTTQSPSREPSARTPVRGGTLTFARPADIFTFDPVNTQDDNSIFIELTVYNRLVKLAPDGKSVEPELATGWEISKDGLTATFHLRPGIKFSDGSPLTADDVAFSLTRIINPNGTWGFLFSPVKSVTAVDASTVQINMTQPFAPLLPALSTFAGSVYSKANFEKYGDQAGAHPLGTGPFMLKEWDKGSQVILVRNSDYWEQGKPYLDGVIFRVVGDDTARVLQLQSGAVDIIDNVPPSQVSQLRGSVQVERVLGSAVGWISLNEAKAPLKDPKVRCALAYSVDRETISKNVYFGLAPPAKSVIPSGTFYYDPTNSITYNLDKAKQLLSESSVPNGFDLQVLVPSGDSTKLSVAEIWSASLAKIGVRVHINQVESTTAQELQNTERYTSAIAGWTNDTPDPDEMIGLGFDYKVINALHSGYHSDPARDLVLRARTEMDPQKRAQLYTQIQQINNEECPWIYTVEPPRLYASKAKVHGFLPNTQGKYSLENVWKTS